MDEAVPLSKYWESYKDNQTPEQAQEDKEWLEVSARSLMNIFERMEAPLGTEEDLKISAQADMECLEQEYSMTPAQMLRCYSVLVDGEDMMPKWLSNWHDSYLILLDLTGGFKS